MRLDTFLINASQISLPSRDNHLGIIIQPKKVSPRFFFNMPYLTGSVEVFMFKKDERNDTLHKCIVTKNTSYSNDYKFY